MAVPSVLSGPPPAAFSTVLQFALFCWALGMSAVGRTISRCLVSQGQVQALIPLASEQKHRVMTQLHQPLSCRHTLLPASVMCGVAVMATSPTSWALPISTMAELGMAWQDSHAKEPQHFLGNPLWWPPGRGQLWPSAGTCASACPGPTCHLPSPQLSTPAQHSRAPLKALGSWS